MMKRVIKVIQNEGTKSNPVSVFTFKSTYGLTWECALNHITQRPTRNPGTLA